MGWLGRRSRLRVISRCQLSVETKRLRIGANNADRIVLCALRLGDCAQAFGREEWLLFVLAQR